MAWQAVTFDDAAKERIKKAAALEKKLRLKAFLNLEEDIGWCKVRPITPKDCVFFELDENRLIINEKAGVDDYIHFAFLLRVDTSEKPKRAVKRLIKSFLRNKDAAKKTADFINQSFLDCPSKNSSDIASTDTGLWLPALIDTFSNQYGWTVDYIMNQPIKSLFMQVQQIYSRNLGKKFSVSNPITQKARARELERLRNG
jgi:hypothetical protein